MKWFSKLISTAYGWSDSIIKIRQGKANKKYKIKKAENEALRIMEEQRLQRSKGDAVSKNLGKRSESQGLVKRDGGDSGDLLDFAELMEFLETFEFEDGE